MGRGDGRGARNLLYGPRPLRGSGPVATVIKKPPRLDGVMSDEEMLDSAENFPLFADGFPRDRQVFILASTPTLSAPPTDKEYYGSVGVFTDSSGDQQFIGWTNYGPSGRGRSQGKVEYEGFDFNGAIAAVNRKLSQKQSAKARSVYQSPGGPHFLSREAVIRR